MVFPGERAASVARAWVRPSSAGVTPLLQPGPTALPPPTRDQDSVVVLGFQFPTRCVAGTTALTCLCPYFCQLSYSVNRVRKKRTILRRNHSPEEALLLFIDFAFDRRADHEDLKGKEAAGY